MNLPKAIEILTDQYKRHKVDGDLDYREAIKLGIQAMKRIQKGRSVDHAFACVRLPGETED